MTKVQVWVDIPDRFELACDHMRPPLDGELYLSPYGDSVCKAALHVSQPRVIIREAWIWPEWLKARWIFREESGIWCAANKRPKLWRCVDDQWHWSWDGKVTELTMTTFEPPPCHGIADSLHENPNWRATDAG
jgi:hypothetical protein